MSRRGRCLYLCNDRKADFGCAVGTDHFRLFIGDLDPAISDDAFRAAFSGDRFPSFVKSKVIRDKYTNKGKGFGFVSYSDPEDFLKAWKEMNGERPWQQVKLRRHSTDSDAYYTPQAST